MSDKSIIFWEQKIVFKDGWYIYMDGKGNNSVISRYCAWKMEAEHQGYMASQDIDRGGLTPEMAYPSRGFSLIRGKYVYTRNEVDILPDCPLQPMKELLIIPKQVGSIEINSIADYAFINQNVIRKVIFTPQIKVIGSSAFANCENLSEVQGLSEHVVVKKNAFHNTKIFRGNQAEYLMNTLLTVDPSYTGSFAVLAGTTSIAENAFENCEWITDLVLPEGLKTIEKSAIKKCTGLKRVVLPSTLENIGVGAFMNCTSLEEIVFPKEMNSIGGSAFEGCTQLNHVILPEGIECLHRGLFKNCKKLMDLVIPDSVKSVGFDAFEDSGILKCFLESEEEELYIGKWLIFYKSYEGKRLQVKPGTVGVADMHFFNKRILQAVIFPQGLKYIGSDAFHVSGICNVELPQELEVLRRAALQGTDIKEVVVPASVIIIEQWVFMDCNNIEQIVIEGKDTEVVWPAITNRRDRRQITIIAPFGSSAQRYCDRYSKKYNLVYKEL